MKHPARSEGINDIEISLVLDVSGSMGWGTKLPDMQDAAKDFIDEVLGGQYRKTAAVSLSLSALLDPGKTPARLSRENSNLTGEHDYSHCVDFDATDFATTALPARRTPPASGAISDPWSSYTKRPRAPRRRRRRLVADVGVPAPKRRSRSRPGRTTPSRSRTRSTR